MTLLDRDRFDSGEMNLIGASEVSTPAVGNLVEIRARFDDDRIICVHACFARAIIIIIDDNV